MNPPSEEVILGNQQHPSAALETFFNPTGPEGKLWGSNVRRRTGIIQIVCGGIEFVLGIAVIFVSASYSDHTDNVGWGVWTGVFAIVTGFFGVCSVKKRCVVIAYMITSIITTILCVGCVPYAVLDAHFGRYGYIGGAIIPVIYIILCMVVLLHMVFSIIGASFTCGAVCCTTDRTQQVVYYTPQPSSQQYTSPLPYTMVASQNDITSKTTTSSLNGTVLLQEV